MTFWIDAQLSPKLAYFLQDKFNVKAVPVREIKLRNASDSEIYFAARKENDIVILTKDRDFIELLERFGPPPKILHITIGNTSNEELQKIFQSKFLKVVEILASENQVELGF